MNLPATAYRWCVILFAAAVGGLLVAAVPVRNDDPDDDVAQNRLIRRMRMTEEMFDQMLYGGNRVVVVENGVHKVVSSSRDDVEKKFQTAAESEIKAVDARCKLTDVQKQKLELAARGDVARWKSRLSDFRSRFAGKELDEDQYREVVGELMGYQRAALSGMPGESSLLRKTLRRILSDDQQAQYRSMVRERYGNFINGVLATCDGTSGSPMTLDTRKQITDIVLEQARLPELNTTPYIQFVLYLEVSRLEDQIKPLLNERQWRAFEEQISNARRAESTLRKNGRWPIQPDEVED